MTAPIITQVIPEFYQVQKFSQSIACGERFRESRLVTVLSVYSFTLSLSYQN
jgi:hypothetical protein